MLIPTYYTFVFAGPNGSGKSSLIAEIKKHGAKLSKGGLTSPSNIINPDQVAKDLVGSFADQTARDFAAFQAVRQMRYDAVQRKAPFGFETVMSHPSRINELLYLKQQGFAIILFFITTDHPDKNVARVALRVQTKSTTGHHVPEKTVRERYERTLALLPKAIELADVAFVYDNSVDYQAPRLQVAIETDQVFSVDEQAQPWVAQRLLIPLQERSDELTQIEAWAASNTIVVHDADELAGQYQGKLIWQGRHFLVQFDTALQQAIIHDLVMLNLMAKPDLAFKGQIHIAYSLENAPKVFAAS